MKRIAEFKFLILVFVVLELLALFLFNQVKEEKRSIYLQSRIAQFEKEYETVIDSYSLVSQTLFDEVINKKEIIDIFKQTRTSDPAKQAEVREKLFEKLNPTYERLKQKNLRQLHFHLPDTTSFLRFHRPEKYGDNLHDIRYSLVKANTEKVNVTGFEEGRIYNGFRYVFPLFDGTTHIGSVETSISFRALRDEMSKLFNGEYEFMIAKKVVESKVFKSELDNYVASDISGDYYFERHSLLRDHDPHAATNTDHIVHNQIRAIDRTLQSQKELQAKLAKHEPYASGFKTDSGCYTVTLIPIENIQKQKVAYLISYQRDQTIGGFGYDMQQKMLISTLMILALIAFMYKSEKLNSLLRKQLALEKKETEQSKKLLVQHSKLAGLGEMIGSIAHQWKQPLNSLGLIIQDLPEAYEYGEMDQQYLDNVVDLSMTQIDFMTRTIEDFRNFFKPSVTQEPFDVSDSLRDVLGLLEAQFKSKEIAVTVDNRLEGERVLGIKNEFDQVLFNLLNNAKDAILDAGTKGKIVILIESDEANIILSIADNGKGIDAEMVGRLFDPYTTSKGEAGTGIGLYMSKTIIHEHMSGTIKLKNSTDGAVFIITLPIIKGEKA